jgi:hypothetical protein
MKEWEFLALRFAAIQGLLMALYHLMLPQQFGWASYVPEGAPTVGWALFALNNYFSFNLLMISTSFAYFVFVRRDALLRILLLAFLLASFWTFSFGYQVVRPMPLPNNLSWLGYFLPGLALGNALIVGLPAWRIARRRGGDLSGSRDSQ